MYYKWPDKLIVPLLLLVMAQLLGAASPTQREQEGLGCGYAWLAARQALPGGTPILSHLLAALPLRLIAGADFDIGDALASRDAAAIGGCLLWGDRSSPEQPATVVARRVLFLARWPNLALFLVLAALVHRWARELYGRFAGVLALLLCAFEPNLLAHARLATADLTVTVFVFAAVYWLWRLLRRPSVRHLFAVGFFGGLALASKFSALLFVPVLAVLLLSRAFVEHPFQLSIRLPLVASVSGETKRGRLAWLVASGVLIALIALLTVWVVYGFQVGALGHVRVLAPDYWQTLRNAPNPFRPDDEVRFLQGELYVGRRWRYLLIAFLLKTPLPLLALLLGSVVASFVHRTWRKNAIVVLPPAFFFIVGLSSQVNTGYRYILPIVPFLLVYAGYVAALVQRWLQGEGAFAGSVSTFGLFFAMLGWYVFGTIAVCPHYLAYFNEIAGGAENGWQSLIGDDLDRGQDLGELGVWLARREIGRVKLAYQGAAEPSFYGIDFEPLPTPFDTWESRYSFYPNDPAPGWYAISVNSLQGLRLSDPETFAWFRQRQPRAKIGYSIFVYEVLRSGEPGVVAGLSGLQPVDILPQDYERFFKTNDVRFKWFDAAHSAIFPAQQGAVLYYMLAGIDSRLAVGQSLPGEIRSTDIAATCYDAPYSAIRVSLSTAEIADAILARRHSTPVWSSPAITFLPGDPAAHAERLALPVDFGGRVELLGYTASAGEIERGDQGDGAWSLTTWWRVLEPGSTPLKVFVHLLDDHSRLVGGDDRLDVPVDGWDVGDVFYQIHHVEAPLDAPIGVCQIELGWYDARTVERLAVRAGGYAVADRVLLSPVRVVAR